MTILVSDTSVIIDLERGGLVEHCFALPNEFAVPDVLYEKEMAEHGGQKLCELGLRVEELTGAELEIVQRVRKESKGLSVPDAYAYSLASSRQWTLLTGDGELRRIAEREKISFNGVLWVTDQIFEHKIIKSEVLVDCLEKIRSHPRCRLPGNEIDARLARYSGKQAKE